MQRLKHQQLRPSELQCAGTFLKESKFKCNFWFNLGELLHTNFHCWPITKSLDSAEGTETWKIQNVVVSAESHIPISYNPALPSYKLLHNKDVAVCSQSWHRYSLKITALTFISVSEASDQYVTNFGFYFVRTCSWISHWFTSYFWTHGYIILLHINWLNELSFMSGAVINEFNS